MGFDPTASISSLVQCIFHRSLTIAQSCICMKDGNGG
ncbi:hypothetical protein AG1IA_03012 [Rhizoctonia solani AG-1 IA]|uniref:Uncharacterized protein n=1 Tax=Thanatephorus cucumeris (strain AG1-IA) TaxID=983506 RepID=L8X2V2_THACA|nr:hypothetical protein AG1IA_03012 [Rhizoctonia solani AG-1 IA]